MDDPDFVVSDVTIRQSVDRQQRLIQQFWLCWKNEYLTSPRDFHKTSVSGHNLYPLKVSHMDTVGQATTNSDDTPSDSVEASQTVEESSIARRVQREAASRAHQKIAEWTNVLQAGGCRELTKLFCLYVLCNCV